MARRPDFDKASEEDLVLRVASQEDVDSMLAIAISNMKASGYSVGEVGAGNGALTKQALVTCIKVPQSALLSYTAMDKEHSSDITRRVPHKTLAYKELTGPLGAAVFGMSKQQWQHTDGRAYGPCTSTDHWRQMLADAGLAEVSTVICPSNTTATFLYRKLPAAPPRVLFVEFPSLHADTPTMDSWLNEYRAALDEVDRDDGNPGTLWLYGTFEEQPGLLGFLHSARKEHKGNCVRALIGWGEPRLDYRSAHDAVGSLDLCVNVFKGGSHGIYAPLEAPYKHLKGEDECLHGAHLNFETYGNLKSAVWRENRPFPQDSSVVICDVTYGALNFRDVMLAYGKLSKQQMAHESGGDNIGFEFSGTTGGRQVMGSAINALATKVITRPNLLWDVPNDWSLAEAATVPTAYMTAYYALVMRGRLRSGMRVLIHSGTGAVGLAAIQICLHRGAEVFVTVGSAAKRQFLLGTFPKLQEDHIGDSRSTSFEGLASVRCLGHWGKLLEIGKYDILQGTPLSMRPMLNNISFEGIDVDRVMNHPDSTELEDLNKLVSEGLISGEVRPLPVTVYPRTHIEEAFRFLASGMHIGKFKVTTLDVGVPDEAEQIIQLAERMAPVGGIFHLAMYLADKLLANQTGESWNKVMHAKAHGAHNLDKASRRLDTLEHFVMWSSIVASAGNEGQTNYAAANAALDILAEKRREEGLPAMSVQWGVVDHVGVADKAIQDLLGSILTVMGLSASAVADSDTLSRLGIDSMQMVEVRSKLQRALGRSVALEDVQSMNIASIKVLEGVDEHAAPAVDDSAPVAEAVKDVALTRSAPVIEPCKIVDLSRDLPSLGPLKPAPLIKASYDPVMRKQPPPISHIDSISSLAPATPDRDLSDNHAFPLDRLLSSDRVTSDQT
ncbi:hypothetical protein WJX73_007935 [Symbiochloris irregularis]|uniref:Carrier domain-containing protein n=1 Tax=Symbiochloris irregularis TaxID=706552 RepID=A0AAW1P5R3_9CHLO